MEEDIFLLLGTNMGDLYGNLHTARSLLHSHAGKIKKCSSVYETEAWGNTAQAAFLNQAVNMHSTLEPQVLLNMLHQIEERMGRTRAVKWEPRIIDIDVLLYGARMIDSEELTVPHKELANRRFALAPLEELAPDMLLPGTEMTIKKLLENCPDPLPVRRIKD